MASTRARAHAPWSASKVATALRCPREFYYRYVDKVQGTDRSPESRLGKAVHGVLEHALQGQPLAEAMAALGEQHLENDAERQRFAAFQPGMVAFMERIAELRRRRRVQRQLVEFTLAVNENFQLTQFHAGDAFFRGIVDAGYLFDDRLAVVDHKTGERRRSLSFTDQLEGYAVLAGAMFRSVRSIWLGVYWIGERELDWAPPVTPREVRERLVPRVMANIEAAALAVDDGPRPQPSDWCLLCSYRSICPAAHDLLLEPVDEEDEPDWES